MKYLALLFSLYFTLLALIPCQDKEDMTAGVVQLTIQKSHSAAGEKGQETCPPFCTCSCCSTAKNLTTNSIIIIFFKVLDHQYPDGRILSVQEQPMAVWQPPQIA
jgi:hypothetical protein